MLSTDFHRDFVLCQLDGTFSSRTNFTGNFAFSCFFFCLFFFCNCMVSTPAIQKRYQIIHIYFDIFSYHVLPYSLKPCLYCFPNQFRSTGCIYITLWYSIYLKRVGSKCWITSKQLIVFDLIHWLLVYMSLCVYISALVYWDWNIQPLGDSTRKQNTFKNHSIFQQAACGCGRNIFHRCSQCPAVWSRSSQTFLQRLNSLLPSRRKNNARARVTC